MLKQCERCFCAKNIAKKDKICSRCFKEIVEECKKENKHFEETHIPRCSICHENFVNAVDSITGKVSPYIWKYNCKHDTGLQLMIG